LGGGEDSENPLDPPFEKRKKSKVKKRKKKKAKRPKIKKKRTLAFSPGREKNTWDGTG